MSSSTVTPAQSSGTTRDRLLDAAAEIFARNGLGAATTREIARAAGVNEVTLFRLFQNKKNLLAAVLERVFTLPAAEVFPPGTDMTLAEIVQSYALRYSTRLNKNLALIRVLMGEIQHFQEHELQVMRGIFKPERQELIDRLTAAQAQGQIRTDVNPILIADQLGSMVFMGALRCSLPLQREYSPTAYFDSCIETIVRAIEVRQAKERHP